MEIRYTSKFEKEYRKLPKAVQLKAEKVEKIFFKNPFDSRLKTHKLSGDLEGFWSFSVTYSERIIFEFYDSTHVMFHSIGNHDIYK